MREHSLGAAAAADHDLCCGVNVTIAELRKKFAFHTNAERFARTRDH